MQHLFQSSAKGKQHEGEQYTDQDYAPFPYTACHSNTGSQPSASCRSQAMNLFAFVRANNDSCTQEPNAGQDALDDPALSTRIVSIGKGQNSHSRTKSH